ncbi:methyl-accepting chemotaxis protein [Acidovorax sp. SDU_ACID1]|uniref:methyl-accepting chemotaxis protein n=1 Tax=Acidovorax sp. SDU_ACID1 TaxID=3136632 RepID=UPI003873ACAA
MHIGQRFWRRQGLGPKLAITNFVWVAAILAVLVAAISWGVTRAMHQKLQSEMEQGITMLGRFIEASDKEQRQRIQFLADSLHETLGSEPLSDDSARLDRFTRATGAVATVFARQDPGFLRVASSLKDDQGRAVVGTLLDQGHPAFAAVTAGQSYMGLATLFGRQYMTHYRPLKDAGGATVGIAFVGMDFSEALGQLKASIRQLKVGGSGYYFVLRSDPQAYGLLAVHPSAEGKNMVTPEGGGQGPAFVREMLERKQGVIAYPWLDAGAQSERDKLAVFGYYAPWNWVYASSAYKDEFVAETRQLMAVFAALGLCAVAVLALVWWWLVRRMIVRPLVQASRMADAIAEGDLTVRIANERKDEIGHLLDDMNNTADGLEKVVRTVHARADGVAIASAEIAQGNQDLASRTESAASALEETAAAMEQLGSTVAHNADHARSADQLTREAQRVVTEGGQAVREVVQTMQGIDASSQKIADIIGVIDGIAFQTNILALNAAVEAARAGEHGRGFAVVAGEVRSLAQRSAEAAKEIKQLITASVSEIHQGNARAARAGETMDQAITEIQKVTRLISDISHASAEQSNGVAQVGEAVSNMDQTTQQNAAMVEEMAGAAESLRQQSDELVRAVSVFRLQGGSAPAAARPAPLPPKAPAPAPARPAAAPLHPAPRAPALTKEAAQDDWESF